MNDSIYTIGFTKKTAEQFYTLIKKNKITLLVDVRLNNVSQLASFSKYPDIQFFLKGICQCKYLSDKQFSPEENTLKDYKSKKIDWNEYVIQFEQTMSERKINEYIKEKYSNLISNESICFLCSEDVPDFCHRKLVAERFSQLFGSKIVHLI